ncbi:MAG: type VI secretion system baseplate subunit TssG [Pseudomonadota bacterium]
MSRDGDDGGDGDDFDRELGLGDESVGPASNPVAEALLARVRKEPYAYSFLRMMRQLEAAYPQQPRLGTSVRAKDDPIRLGQTPALTFAPSELHSVSARGGGAPLVLGHFFGLLGPNGPMPIHFTEYVRDRQFNASDRTLARFLDIFHHRMMCLFYRAWAETQPTVHADRPDQDRFAFWVASLVGMGQPSLLDQSALEDDAVFSRVGRFSLQCRPADGLGEALADYFGAQVEVQEFVGEWLDLPSEAHLLLGMRGGGGGRLGLSATIGERVWSGQTRFRIVLNDLRLVEFERFLPDGESLPKLVALVRRYCGDELTFDLQLALRCDEVPPLMLGSGARLGLSAWLAQPDRTAPARDAILEPLHYVDGRAGGHEHEPRRAANQ